MNVRLMAFALAVVMGGLPAAAGATDAVHFYFVNSTSSTATFSVQYLAEKLSTCSAGLDAPGFCTGTNVNGQSSTTPGTAGTSCVGLSVVVAPGGSSGDVCSFTITCVFSCGFSVQQGQFLINGTLVNNSQWQVNDPTFGPLQLSLIGDQGTTNMPANMTLVSAGKSSYNFTFTWTGNYNN